MVSVSGCGVLSDRSSQVQTDVMSGAAVVSEVSQRPQSRPETVASDASAGTEVSVGTLGRTVASLGNAGEPGLWLKTPLVSAQRQARVHFPKTGKSVAVTLIPIEGPRTAGSRISLAAMQALGAPLTDLIEVDVFGF